MALDKEKERDLVLAPGQYAYLQDQTKGQIKTYVGPTVINQTGQDSPVKYNPNTQDFQDCTLKEAMAKSPVASEGDYIILENPAKDQSHPEDSSSRPSPTLVNGSKVNLPGPTTFALWPGQRASVLKGHHLRSNQYLVVRVYNETEAKANWKRAVAVQTGAPNPDSQTPTPTIKEFDVSKLTIGKLMIIKGTEVSFYIPPTGVEVQQEEVETDEGVVGEYVRDAITLERLEYCILIDEDGNKRYEKGPQVVFPNPTETFYSESSQRKFKAIELNLIQGLHIKAIADYEEENVSHKVGDEMFLTGEKCSIYYPRVEHSIIKYGDRTKHYATAIPAGEARYLMNRDTGKIETIRGPRMLLPNPIKEVMVKRVLSDKQCSLWYPGNNEANLYNSNLRNMMAGAGSGNAPLANLHQFSNAASSNITASNTEALDYYVSGSPLMGGTPTGGAVARSAKNKPSPQAANQMFAALSPNLTPVTSGLVPSNTLADVMPRGTQFTAPRMITLDTKYDGVPAIQIWTGYSCMIVSKTGARKVANGPTTVLLDYDESLEVLELSTGKPKNTDSLQKTVYLRVANNKVSDIVQVTTGDHVNVVFKLSYQVNFEGTDSAKWFAVENYVKHLCDHARSLLKGMSQKRKVEDFSSNGVDIIRDSILGLSSEGKRPGMLFPENNMRVTDVEVLSIEVADANIARMINMAQHEVVGANIRLHQAEKTLEVTKREEDIFRQMEEARTATATRKLELEKQKLEEQLKLALAQISSELTQVKDRKTVEEERQATATLTHNADLERLKSRTMQALELAKAEADIKIATLIAETNSVKERFSAAQGSFSEALITLGSQEAMGKIAEALSVQNIIGGKNVVDVLSKMFAGSPLEGAMKKLSDQAAIPQNPPKIQATQQR